VLFNSYEFIFVFLPITLALFFIIGSRGHHKIAMSWLVGASLFFYGWWNPAYLGLIMSSMLFNYAIGVGLGNGKQLQRKTLLICGIIVNLSLIGYFKYANFFIDNLNSVINNSIHLESVILPLAISFFTFQQIAYLVDAYKGEAKEYDFLHYCLFVTFFPQLIAGPIVHHREMMPQFLNRSVYRLSYNHIAAGSTIFLLGLFKKVAIADSFAFYATPVFEMAESGEPLTFFVAWGGALSYTFQLYFDFSGYSDMAIGLARMFGIKLPLNFNSPYKAVNIIEFWRRWHMTLSRFLRDYVYIPLGGNKKGKLRRYTNLLLTMLLGGLWHGAGWTFVAWGGLHGFYLMVNYGWRSMRKRLGMDLTKKTLLGVVLSTTVTFLSVVVSWVFFRAESFTAGKNIIMAMLDISSATGINSSNIAKFHILFILLALFIIWFAPNSQTIVFDSENRDIKFRYKWLSYFNSRLRWKPAIISGLIIGFIFTSTLILLERKSEFLYFQF